MGKEYRGDITIEVSEDAAERCHVIHPALGVVGCAFWPVPAGSEDDEGPAVVARLQTQEPEIYQQIIIEQRGCYVLATPLEWVVQHELQHCRVGHFH